MQVSTDLVNKNADGSISPVEITNGFLTFFAALSDFRIQFLLVTHFFITFYVAVDSYLTTKVLYSTMGVIYLVSVLQLFYGGARPFWTTDQIMSSSCL